MTERRKDGKTESGRWVSPSVLPSFRLSRLHQPPPLRVHLHRRGRAVTLPVGRHAGYAALDVHTQDTPIQADLTVGHPVGAPRRLLDLAERHEKMSGVELGGHVEHGVARLE